MAELRGPEVCKGRMQVRHEGIESACSPRSASRCGCYGRPCAQGYRPRTVRATIPRVASRQGAAAWRHGSVQACRHGSKVHYLCTSNAFGGHLARAVTDVRSARFGALLNEGVRGCGKGGIGSPDRRHVQIGASPAAPVSGPGEDSSASTGPMNSIGADPSQSVSTALAIRSPRPRL